MGSANCSIFGISLQRPADGGGELRQLRQLQEENGRLKRLVADLTLDKQILSEVIRKKI